MKLLITLSLLSTIVITACDTKAVSPTPPTSTSQPSDTKVSFTQVKSIITQRCSTCHSATSTDTSFGNMPGGVAYDTDAQIQSGAQRIKARTVVSKDMPKMNKTNITQEERDLIGKWVDQGASIN